MFILVSHWKELIVQSPAAGHVLNFLQGIAKGDNKGPLGYEGVGEIEEQQGMAHFEQKDPVDGTYQEKYLRCAPKGVLLSSVHHV